MLTVDCTICTPRLKSLTLVPRSSGEMIMTPKLLQSLFILPVIAQLM